MDFLKGKFDDELSARIDNGIVSIAGYPFAPDIILKMDSTIYDEAFIE